MSTRHDIDNASPEEARRYEIVITRDDQGLERFTIERRADSAIEPWEERPRAQLVELACGIYEARRSRGRFFNSELFGEPVWDMLLALFCVPAQRENLSITGLCYSVDVPPTTGLRCVKKMERGGLIIRRPDPLDGRRIYMQLTDKGETLMNNYLSANYHRLSGS